MRNLVTLAGLFLVLGVIDVAEHLAIARLGIHARPEDAGVPVDVKPLAGGIVEGVITAGHANALLDRYV